MSSDSTRVNRCYFCGAELNDNVERCPECGRRQYRICYCGTKLKRDVERCPVCGTDWTRVSVRRRKSSRRRRRSVIFYVAVGSISALALAGIVVGVARELQGGGGAALVNAARACVGFLKVHVLQIVGIVIIAGAGGGAGALIYYYLGRNSRASKAR